MTIITNNSEIVVSEWTAPDPDGTTPTYHLSFSSDVRRNMEYVNELYRGFYSGNEVVDTLRRLELDVHKLQEEKREFDRLIANNPAVKEAYENFKIMAALAAEEAK